MCSVPTGYSQTKYILFKLIKYTCKPGQDFFFVTLNTKLLIIINYYYI